MPNLRPVPPFDADLQPVLHAHGRLGTDANGSPLYAEKLAYVDRNCDDEGAREAYLELWDEIEAETAAALEEEREERERGR